LGQFAAELVVLNVPADSVEEVQDLGGVLGETVGGDLMLGAITECEGFEFNRIDDAVAFQDILVGAVLEQAHLRFLISGVDKRWRGSILTSDWYADMMGGDVVAVAVVVISLSSGIGVND
jgi:hypothetical protein